MAFASFSGTLFDAKTKKPLKNALISDSYNSVKSDAEGHFGISTKETTLHVKSYGHRPFSLETNSTKKSFYIQPIKVKALYLTFWGASNNSKTLKNILEIIKKTEANAIVVDVKNEYGSTSFLTSFEKANSYGAHKNRTNRNITKFIKIMKENNIYTIARIVTFKDELQASHNQEYAIKKEATGKIWRNSDNMAWVNPFDKRSHNYTIRIAQEAAKVGFDEINFDYIRFPAKAGLKFSRKNTQQNRVHTINQFLEEAQKKLKKYGVFISVDIYGNVLWSKDDNRIGQTLESLSKNADYIAPMLYPSGFASGSFNVKHPASHPYIVIYRSIKHIQNRIDTSRIRPWLQYFRDYTRKKEYKKFEIQEQMRATEDIKTNGWMMWSPSSKYHSEYLKK